MEGEDEGEPTTWAAPESDSEEEYGMEAARRTLRSDGLAQVSPALLFLITSR